MLSGIFRRAAGQLAVGAAAGILIALVLDHYLQLPIELMGGDVPGVIAGVTLFMVMVGLFATAGPARRGLQVEPTEALREG